MAENISVNNKRIAINTILLYVRMLVTMLVSLYTSRVILQELGVDDYGIYNIVGGFVAMFSMISGSMSSAISRFLTFELGKGDLDRLKRIFSSSITIQLIFSAFILIVGETLGVWYLNEKMVIPYDRLTAANWCLQFSLVTFVVNIVSTPYNAVIIAHEKMSAFAYISIFEALGKLGIAFMLISSPFDKLVYYALLSAVLAIIIRFIYGWYCKRHFEEASSHLSLDKEELVPMFRFAGWNLFGSGSLVLRNQGVDLLLNAYFGVAVNAAKGICNQVQNAVYQFVTNFQTAVNPQLTMAIAQNDYERNHILVIQGTRFSFYLLSFFSIPFLIETSNILSLWLVEVPEHTVKFVQWTFIYLQMDCLSRFLINSVLAYGKIRNYQIAIGGTKLLVLPIVWLVLALGGSPVSGVIINAVIEVICLVMRLFFNKKYTNLSVGTFLRDAFVHCWLVFIIIWAVMLIIKEFLNLHYMLIIILSLFVTVVFIWFMGLKQMERQMFLMKIQNIIKCRIEKNK